MQSHRPLAAGPLLLLGLLFALVGCSSFHNPFARDPELVGTWGNRLGSVWIVQTDGTFELNHGGRFITRGTYQIHKDKLTLLYTGGKIPWDGHESATYRIKPDKKIVRFVLLHDICAERIVNLSVRWKKISSVN